MRYDFQAEVWLYSGEAAWHFVTLPAELTDSLKTMGRRSKGWGSMRVKATIGETSWRTSLFPDSRSSAFLLPLKADVRRRANIRAGDWLALSVELEL